MFVVVVLFVCFLLFSLVALIVFFVVFKFTVNVYTGRAFCGRLKPPCLSSPPFFAPTQKWNLPWWRSRSIIGWVFKAFHNSECSFLCFACCREFCFYNFCFLG